MLNSNPWLSVKLRGFSSFVAAVMFVVVQSSSQAAPVITSVSLISSNQVQTITIAGGGFGTQNPYTGDSVDISFSDVPRNWEAGFAGPCPPVFNGCSGNAVVDDALGLVIQSWSDSSIVLGGFSGPWGATGFGCTPTCLLAASDEILIYVWNPQTGAGPASAVEFVSGVPEANTFGLIWLGLAVVLMVPRVCTIIHRRSSGDGRNSQGL